MTIIEEIRVNKVVYLHLSAVPEEYFGEISEIIAALKDNTSIESIQFDEDFIGCAIGRERGKLLNQVAKLPNLKEVFLGDACLMVDAIATMLKSAKCLRKISLHRLVMQGIEKDFEGLAAVLSHHGSLKGFKMEDCVASNEDIDIERIMNPPFFLPSNIMTIIEEIRANKVVYLHLNAVPEEYFGEISEIIAALKDNTSIESIQFDEDFIGCVFGRDRGKLLNQVAKLPNLKEVFLGDACLMVDAIATMLKSAKCLRKISLHRLVMQGIEKDFEGLAAVLYHHGSLKGFKMEDCVASNEDIDIERITNAGKNFTTSSIDKPIHSKVSAIAA
jgi:phosphoribosylformylglycinamidine (FGAM) synthase PurS component